MNKLLFLSLLVFTFGTSLAQTIEFEYANPQPQFQDADVGSIDFGDVDGDGDNDFIAMGKGGPILTTLYTNDGTGNFTEVTGTPFDKAFDGMVRFVDIDGDNDLDVFLTGQNNQSTAIAKLYTNDGTGNFTEVMNTPFQSGNFAFGDVDNDNDLDVLISGHGSVSMELYLNNGSHSFTTVTATNLIGVKLSNIEFLDIEGDNDLDIIATGEETNGTKSTTLYANDGSGNFSVMANTSFVGVTSGDIAVADADGDNDMDILISGSSDNGNVSNLYTNNGSGAFSLVANTNFAGTTVGASEFADFDNDGDQDILIVGSSDQVIAIVYENQGNNTFLAADSLFGAYLSSIAIGDIDGDNDLDVAIAGTSFTAPTRSTKLYINETTTSTKNILELPRNALIYPNPTSGTVNIELKQAQTATIRIYNTVGMLVYEERNIPSSHQINLEKPSGVYMMVVETDENTITYRLILRQ